MSPTLQGFLGDPPDLARLLGFPAGVEFPTLQVRKRVPGDLARLGLRRHLHIPSCVPSPAHRSVVTAVR